MERLLAPERIRYTPVGLRSHVSIVSQPPIAGGREPY
jgi:hypothetical protein